MFKIKTIVCNQLRVLALLLSSSVLSIEINGHSQSTQRASQTITWNQPAFGTLLRIDELYALQASASSGLPVVFRVQRGPALITDGVVTATGSGTIVVMAEQPGDETFDSTIQSRTFNQSEVTALPLGLVEYPDSRGADVRIRGTTVFSAAGNWLRIIDVSDPGAPELLSSTVFSYSAEGVAVVGDLVYVAAYGSGLQILNVSDIHNPILVKAYETRAFAYDVDVAGNLAFVAEPAFRFSMWKIPRRQS